MLGCMGSFAGEVETCGALAADLPPPLRAAPCVHQLPALGAA